MYKVIPWNENLDLSDFYKTARDKGFTNNASQHMLVDCFRKEIAWNVWILYFNEIAVGSVAAHSFPEMGDHAYRIAARTCVFTDRLPAVSLRTPNQIVTHQHVTSQFLIPTCIDWVPTNSKMYITTNENESGTQRLVHRIFAPAMEKTGQMKRVTDLFYRGTLQTVWEFYPTVFMQELAKHKTWTNK